MATPVSIDGIGPLLDRAFLTAHLLTASVEQAESAISKAIGSWNPDEETEEALFQNVLDAAARSPVEPASHHLSVSDSYLPEELRAILRLAPPLRRCFVLRMFAGLPLEACARLLRLPAGEVARHTCAALESLPA